MDRTFWPSIVALLTIFGFFEITNADLWVQDHFYNFACHAWLVNSKATLPRLLFYSGPKLLIWLFGIGVLTLLFAPYHWRVRFGFNHFDRPDLWILLGTLALAPLSIASLKATTNVCTPAEIRRYGGNSPYVKVCRLYPTGVHQNKRGRGFPAGHASGGFALLALVGISRTNLGRRIGIGIGLTLGTWMGGYQMLKGAHYLSHTLITAILCWIIFLLLRRIRRIFPLKN